MNIESMESLPTELAKLCSDLVGPDHVWTDEQRQRYDRLDRTLERTAKEYDI